MAGAPGRGGGHEPTRHTQAVSLPGGACPLSAFHACLSPQGLSWLSLLPEQAALPWYLGS